MADEYGSAFVILRCTLKIINKSAEIRILRVL